MGIGTFLLPAIKRAVVSDDEPRTADKCQASKSPPQQHLLRSRSPPNSFLALLHLSSLQRYELLVNRSKATFEVVVGSATNPIDGRIRVVVGSSGVSNHTMKPASAIVVAFPGLLGCGGTLSASSSSSSSSS